MKTIITLYLLLFGAIALQAQDRGVRNDRNTSATNTTTSADGSAKSGGTTAFQVQELTPFKGTNGKHGYKDQNGKEIIVPKYDGAGQFEDGLAPIRLDGKWGYIDKTGQVIVPPTYKWVGPFSDGLAIVLRSILLGDKFNYIDKTGKVILETDYFYAEPFYEGLAGVSKDGKWGFIDKKGKEVIPLQYEKVGRFSDGLVAVGKSAGFGSEWGFVDKTGKEVIPIQFRGLFSPRFENGKAKVFKDGKEIYIDKTGKEVQQ